MWMTAHDCLHEAQIVEQSQKLAKLEAKNGFKEERIKELIDDNKRIEKKIDGLNSHGLNVRVATLSKFMLKF